MLTSFLGRHTTQSVNGELSITNEPGYTLYATMFHAPFATQPLSHVRLIEMACFAERVLQSIDADDITGLYSALACLHDDERKPRVNGEKKYRMFDNAEFA